jgi:hypothetical protein
MVKRVATLSVTRVMVPPAVSLLAAFVGLAHAAPVQLADAELDRIVAGDGNGNGNGNGNIGNNNGNNNQGNNNGNGNFSSGNGNGNTTDNNGNGPGWVDPFDLSDILEVGTDTTIIGRRDLEFVFNGADTQQLSNRHLDSVIDYGFSLYGNDGSAFGLFADRLRSLVLP